MSNVKGTYKVHPNIESAKQYELSRMGRSSWSREEPPPIDRQSILIKCVLLILAFLKSTTAREVDSFGINPPIDRQSILIKCVLLILAFLLPVALTLASFKWVFRAFVVAGLLFLSVETNAAPERKHAKISGIAALLVGGSLYGSSRFWLYKPNSCLKGKGLFSNRTVIEKQKQRQFNPTRK